MHIHINNINTWQLEVISCPQFSKDSYTKTHNYQQVSTRCVDKVSHLIAFCAWASSPHLPVQFVLAKTHPAQWVALHYLRLSFYSVRCGSLQVHGMYLYASFNSCQVALMVPFNLLVGSLLMKAGLRSASMECGGQCVMITGIPLMPELCADS